jgi:hypothetical protein
MDSSVPLSRGLNQPRCHDSAPATNPAAYNAHKPAGASGLVQHVFHSPARIPVAEPPRGDLCAAPPSEKRYSLSSNVGWVHVISKHAAEPDTPVGRPSNPMQDVPPTIHAISEVIHVYIEIMISPGLR